MPTRRFPLGVRKNHADTRGVPVRHQTSEVECRGARDETALSVHLSRAVTSWEHVTECALRSLRVSPRRNEETLPTP